MLTERFCEDLLENWFGRQRSLGSRKDNQSVAHFGYNSNITIMLFKPIAHGNVADSEMIALKKTSHFHVVKLKKNESLNVNIE